MVDLHLYRIGSLALPPQALRSLLSAEERNRVERFHRSIDRERQTAAAALLRLVLAGYLSRDPGAIELTRTEHGKPMLPGGPSFNLSHSGEWILIGIADEGRLGVDIEVVRPLSDLEALAGCTFAPDEVRALRALPQAERERAFFRAWTRKEAYLKAVGLGFSLPPDSFTVSLGPGARSALLRSHDPAECASGWIVRSVAAPPATEIALAWDRPSCRVRRVSTLTTASFSPHS